MNNKFVAKALKRIATKLAVVDQLEAAKENIIETLCEYRRMQAKIKNTLC